MKKLWRIFNKSRKLKLTTELKTSLVLGCLLNRTIHGYAYYNGLISDKESCLITECEKKLESCISNFKQKKI